MNYGKIYEVDTANGPGCRTSLFVSGCTHHCKGCFNKDTWDFSYGNPYTKEVEDYIISTLSPSHVDGLTVLGGEPMEPGNQEALLPLYERVSKSIWVYSGYTWEELTDPENKRCHGPYTDRILELIDVLVDGEFVLEKKNLRLSFRGSENQRIIDVKESLRRGEVITIKVKGGRT